MQYANECEMLKRSCEKANDDDVDATPIKFLHRGPCSNSGNGDERDQDGFDEAGETMIISDGMATMFTCDNISAPAFVK